MDSQALLDLVLQHKWWALAALVIGTIVRLLKSDGPIPFNLPSKYRPWLAVALGVVAGVVDKIATGTAWKDALAGGLVAALFAMGGHSLFVESARGGREFGESKPAFKARSIRPPPMPPTAAPPS